MSLDHRNQGLKQLEDTEFDVLIIGGGINGAVSAASLSHRGLKVALIDGRDFAGFTSQQSSNLVWGGIKYMESYEFGLVLGLCKSRNELMRSFPSVVKEIRFLTTVSKQFRHHRLVIWASAWLYWLLGRGYTRRPRLLTAAQISAEEPVVDTSNSRGGIIYSDAFLHDNDARFVFNFIRSAIDQGCVAANYIESTTAKKSENGWQVDVKDTVSGRVFAVRSRVLINATGAFVDSHNEAAGVVTKHHHVFSKGIHLLVPRISSIERVLAFFADDGRLFFAIPMGNRTCIGTTDTRVDSPMVAVTDEDRDFVLININTCLKLPRKLTRDDIIAERCGVRPLVVEADSTASLDFLQLSRKHVIEENHALNHVSIFGGKLTDCLNIGEEIAELMASMGLNLSDLQSKWYGEGDAEERKVYDRLAAILGVDQVFAPDTGESVAVRLWRRYGRDATKMLEAIQTDPELLETAIAETGVRWCEIAHLSEHEMVVSLEDFLRRRSKIELLYSRETLRASMGLRAVCDHLFGSDAEKRWQEYFANKAD
jgi:glycerol-3-phosphate dehydrogenase